MGWNFTHNYIKVAFTMSGNISLLCGTIKYRLSVTRYRYFFSETPENKQTSKQKLLLM